MCKLIDVFKNGNKLKMDEYISVYSDMLRDICSNNDFDAARLILDSSAYSLLDKENISSIYPNTKSLSAVAACILACHPVYGDLHSIIFNYTRCVAFKYGKLGASILSYCILYTSFSNTGNNVINNIISDYLCKNKSSFIKLVKDLFHAVIKEFPDFVFCGDSFNILLDCIDYINDRYDEHLSNYIHEHVFKLFDTSVILTTKENMLIVNKFIRSYFSLIGHSLLGTGAYDYIQDFKTTYLDMLYPSVSRRVLVRHYFYKAIKSVYNKIRNIDYNFSEFYFLIGDNRFKRDFSMNLFYMHCDSSLAYFSFMFMLNNAFEHLSEDKSRFHDIEDKFNKVLFNDMCSPSYISKCITEMLTSEILVSDNKLCTYINTAEAVNVLNYQARSCEYNIEKEVTIGV